MCDLWEPWGSRGEAPVKNEHRRRSRMRAACPPVRIETFRLSDGGCSCYRFLVNVCGARRAPAAATGRVPPLPKSPRAAAPCRPKAGPRGCPPPLGLAAPRRRGGLFRPPRRARGPVFPLRRVPPPSPDVRRVLSRRFPDLSVRCRVDPVPPEHGGLSAPVLVVGSVNPGLAVERVSVLVSGGACPGEGARRLDRGASADGRRGRSSVEVGSRPDSGGRRPFSCRPSALRR